jgi:undecaprenyl-diphosphatase
MNQPFRSILELDDRLSHRLRVAEKPGFLRSLAAVVNHSGDSWFWLAGLLLGIFLVSGSWRLFFIILALAIFVTAALVLVLKFTIRRQRPAGDWGQVYRETDPHSFPSGHAARGLLIGVIALGLAPAWLGLVLITWGPMVGLARVAMGVHYISDVLAGWVLGLGMGLLTLFVAHTWLL